MEAGKACFIGSVNGCLVLSVGSYLSLPSKKTKSGDYWEEDIQQINVKELSAVLQAVRCLPASVRDCRIDVRVDNQVTINSWHGRGPKSPRLFRVARLLFE